MSAMTILVVVLALLTVCLVLAGWGVVTAWRCERSRARLLAERLVVEGRIEALTVQTLQAMRQIAREQLAGRGRQ
jgi:hypothetical protein